MTYSAEVLADSPLAYYRLGEASGTTITDSSGNSRNGTWTATPTQGVDGLILGDADDAVDMDGSTHYGQVTDAAWMDSSTIALEAWIKPDVVNAFGILLSRDNGNFTGDNMRYWQLRVSDTGKAQFVFYASDGGATQVVTGTTTMLVGQRYHVAATYDGSVGRVYLNGVQEASVSISGAIPTSTVAANVGIGRALVGTAFSYNGVLDEAAIYSSLSAARVEAHYFEGMFGEGPAIRASSVANTGSNVGAINLVIPSTTVIGDMLVLCIMLQGDSTITTPSGFTLVDDHRTGTATTDATGGIFKRVAQSGDAGANVSIAGSTTGRKAAAMLVLKDCSDVGLTDSATPSPAPTLTVADDSLLLAFFGRSEALSNIQVTPSSPLYVRTNTVNTQMALGTGWQAFVTGAATGTKDSSPSAVDLGFSVEALGTAVVAADLTLDATVAAPTWVLAADFQIAPEQNVTLTGTVSAPTWTLVGDFELDPVIISSDLDLAGTLTAPTWTLAGAFVLANDTDLAFTGTVSAPTWTLAADFVIEYLPNDPAVNLIGTLTAPTWLLVGAFEMPAVGVATDTTNRVGGLQFSGYMTWDYTPPVVAPPASLAPAHSYEVARAHSVPVLTEGRQPTFTVTTARQVRHRDRVLVGGKDITFWRDVHTPTPDYSLVDPLRYGAGSLSLPQVHALFETPGEGALTFLAKGKTVIVQRVDPETGDVVAADDYRGLVMDYDIDGDDLTLVLAGEVTGRMQIRWHATPAFKSLKDVGRMVYNAFRTTVPAVFSPRLGPTTGIKLNTFGGMWMIDHVSEVLAKAVQADGDQYTIDRRPNGTWGMWIKDRETIDATIYFDDAAMKFSGKQSLSESPNRVFVTAVAKDGRRINFRVYPGLKQGEAPPYPTTGPFGEGTTNDDLDNPEDAPIDAMIHRLVTMGYLSREDNTDYSYDADVTAAIERLQEDAGLTESGDMNLATWRALYDLDATGFTLAGVETLPAAQLGKTRMWNRTASGALSTRNQNYDATVMKVDLPISMGSVRSRQKARELAKTKVHAGGDWLGSVDCHLALIAGEHTPGDPITTIMPARALRNGMNIWAPLFDGGTLFHLVGADVSNNGTLVKIALDTRARPTMEAWEVLQQRAESRKHPTRLWINEHRGVMLDKDGGEWDDVAGLIDDRVRLRGGRWTQFPIVGGQEGTVRSLRTRLSPAERYAMAVFGKRIGPRDGTSPWLDRLVPLPLSEGGSERWDSPAVRRKLDDRILLYTAGQFDQALGYFPGRETNDAGEDTGHPVNGRWEDDAGFSYHTFAEPVLYVALWVADDTSLTAGRLMWDQFNNTGE